MARCIPHPARLGPSLAGKLSCLEYPSWPPFRLCPQAWPLTPLYGSLVGYLVGSLGSLSVNLVDWFVKEDTNIKLKEYRTE